MFKANVIVLLFSNRVENIAKATNYDIIVYSHQTNPLMIVFSSLIGCDSDGSWYQHSIIFNDSLTVLKSSI